MEPTPHNPPSHDHLFGQDRMCASEKRTKIVVGLTAVTMVVEIAAGMMYGSMALLADGLHMASHAVALGIAAFAYRYARRHAADRSFSFGTGKVGALAGYSGAVLLGIFSLGMAVESVGRLVNPVPIVIDQALLVAVLGLLVNGASVVILGRTGAQAESHAPHHHEEGEHGRDHHQDHNLRSAYLHVLADAMTSVLAIAALLAAKLARLTWLDPLMGVLGAVLVARWSVGLLRQSAQVLLDRQAPGRVLEDIRAKLEQLPATTVSDLHVWSIGTGKRAAIIGIRTGAPLDACEYRNMLPPDCDLAHVSIEVCSCTARKDGRST